MIEALNQTNMKCRIEITSETKSVWKQPESEPLVPCTPRRGQSACPNQGRSAPRPPTGGSLTSFSQELKRKAILKPHVSQRQMGLNQRRVGLRSRFNTLELKVAFRFCSDGWASAQNVCF